MNLTLRILYVLVTFVAFFFFVYWVPFSIFSPNHEGELPRTISIIVAAAAAVYVWVQTGRASDSFGNFVLKWALIVGATGFIIGFLGPILFRPDANQGPLLGIFFTGPIGFVAGMAGSAVYWMVRKKRASARADLSAEASAQAESE